ncbi:MAG: hypothetical protein WBQ25_17745 [Nitrososphaeraceae archaeon]
MDADSYHGFQIPQLMWVLLSCLSFPVGLGSGVNPGIAVDSSDTVYVPNDLNIVLQIYNNETLVNRLDEAHSRALAIQRINDDRNRRTTIMIDYF